MTCIVGLVQGRKMYMGADSLATSYYNSIVREDKKLFRKNGYLVGVAGSVRIKQVIQHNMPTACSSEKDSDLLEFMATSFVDSLRGSLHNGGCLEVIDGVESLKDSQILVGLNGKLFSVLQDFQIEVVGYNFISIGSGSTEANSSLWTMQRLKNISPLTRIKTAIECSSEFNASVSPPIHTLSMSF